MSRDPESVLLAGMFLMLVGLVVLAISGGGGDGGIFVFPFFFVSTSGPAGIVLGTIMLAITIFMVFYFMRAMMVGPAPPYGAGEDDRTPFSMHRDAVWRTCPVCGRPLAPDHRFCPTCGTQVDSDTEHWDM